MLFLKSRRIQLLALLTVIYFVYFVLWRALFFGYFFGFDTDLDSADLLYAFYMGIKFDLRLALIVLLPVCFNLLLPKVNLLSSTRSRSLIKWYLSAAMVLLSIFYMLDFGYYAYLGERIDASLLRFAETPLISLQMVWESYPIIWQTLFTLAVFWLCSKLFGRVLGVVEKPAQPSSKKQQLVTAVLASICVLYGMIGKIDGIRLESVTVLRWSEAYFANDMSVAAVALNPVLFFADTYSNRGHSYDEEIVKSSYPLIRKHLGLSAAQASNTDELHYLRDSKDAAGDDLVMPMERAPNIVLIMLESLGANRLGIFNNPLDPTPNLDALAKQGHFFPNFYVPSSGTARTVFGKMTGIPDVSFGQTTASRNPLFSNQQIIVNTLDNYEKYYFLGGSANWANVRAVLANNIEDLNLYEEGDWQSENVDVWGISDRNLLRESHDILLKRDASKPFFAVIQTAANHRPFTIPDDDSRFEKKEISDALAQQHGFLGSDQFNAIRLLDFNIGFYFRELVKNSNYADNTLFLLYGDHNDKSKPSPHLSEDDQLKLFKHHVPFMIYAPAILKESRVIETPMSLVDMLPSAAFLAGVPYRNTTLGRNIYAVGDDDDSYVIVHGGDRRNRPTIGLRGREFYLQMLHDGEQVSLHKLGSDNVKEDVQEEYPDKAAAMKDLLLGIYHTATYMMYNNKKLPEQER